MTSNDKIGKISQLGDNKSPDVKKLQEAARLELIRAYEVVGPSIDKLTSSKLKKVLKFITGFSEIEHLITNKKPSFEVDEQKLIDSLLAFKQTTLGFYALLDETNSKTNSKEENTNE